MGRADRRGSLGAIPRTRMASHQDGLQGPHPEGVLPDAPRHVRPEERATAIDAVPGRPRHRRSMASS
eukprot:10319309-Heterocapsa_arctica.AAC.1